MIIGIIVFLFCVAGVYGFYNGLIFLTYIGMILAIIEMIIGFIKKESKSLMSLWLCVILACGAAIAGNDFIQSLAIFLCFENISLFIVGCFLLLFGITKIKRTTPNNNESKTLDEYIENKITKEGTRTSFGELRKDDSYNIFSIVNNQERLSNIINGTESIDSMLFIGKQNPYTGKTISNYDDIILYLKMYKLDFDGKDPLSIKKEVE